MKFSTKGLNPAEAEMKKIMQLERLGMATAADEERLSLLTEGIRQGVDAKKGNAEKAEFELHSLRTTPEHR